jgi:leucyl aminopeptidase
MKISIQKSAPHEKAADVIVCGVFSSESSSDKNDGNPTNFRLPAALKAMDKKLGGLLQKTARAEGFCGQKGESLTLHTHGKIRAKTVQLSGLGSAESFNSNTLRQLGGRAFQAGKSKHKKAGIWVDFASISTEDSVQAIAEGIRLSAYSFDRYKTKGQKEAKLNDISILTENKIEAGHRDALVRAEHISSGVLLARDLVNECAGVLNPVAFAESATQVAKESGLAVKILGEKELKKEKMGLMLAVSQASTPYTPPRLIRLSYKPAGRPTGKVALVGKGVTFDTGGLDVKPPAGMLDMKIDMAGAGCVLGAMLAIGKLKPDIAVTGYLACVENGVGGNAYHPGDVILSRKGLTVEINNTDAEGRLVMADTMDYALELDKPDTIIDVATLTGACMVALGPHTAGLFSNDDDLAAQISQASENVGEGFWRLPLTETLNKQLRSDIADLKNTGERWGGAITAALFLKNFINEDVSWAHLDIAGPASSNQTGAYTSRGGTGFAVRTLVDYVMKR